MDGSRREQLEAIVELSRQMLKEAQALNWERVSELEATRKRSITSCFRQSCSEREALQTAPLIKSILQINDEITALGRDNMTRLSGELKVHKLGRTASAAYLGNSR